MSLYSIEVELGKQTNALHHIATELSQLRVVLLQLTKAIQDRDKE